MKIQFRYLEDFQVGQKGVTLTRTVTEADIVNFACLVSDYNRVHLDRHYTMDTLYGGRVAHGVLGFCLSSGMLSLTAPHTIGRGVPGAYLWSINVGCRGAIKLADTIKIRWSVAEKSNDPAHEGYGLVKTNFEVVNQDDVSVYDGTFGVLVRKESAKNARLKLEPGKPWQVEELVLDPGKFYYIEDYEVGKGGESDGRTITEADVVRFAGLTGDYNPQQVDVEYARESQFGERIAHGMLIFAVTNGLRGLASGLAQQGKSKIAGHLGDNISFLAPVKIGDTIHCRYKIVANRVSKSKPELGIMTYGVQAINQRDEVVLEGSVFNMMPTRAGKGKEGEE